MCSRRLHFVGAALLDWMKLSAERLGPAWSTNKGSIKLKQWFSSVFTSQIDVFLCFSEALLTTSSSAFSTGLNSLKWIQMFEFSFLIKFLQTLPILFLLTHFLKPIISQWPSHISWKYWVNSFFYPIITIIWLYWRIIMHVTKYIAMAALTILN